jgi:hypothetical protein
MLTFKYKKWAASGDPPHCERDLWVRQHAGEEDEHLSTSISITADAADSLGNPGWSAKAAQVKPAHVSLHLGLHTMYANWPSTSTHHVRLSESEAPSRPRPSQYVASQLSATWSTRLAARM